MASEFDSTAFSPWIPAAWPPIAVALEAVSDRVAVLNQHGIIVWVNQAWREQSLNLSPFPGNPTPKTQVGSNYLAVTRNAIHAAATGIQCVLDGSQDTFSLSYPCASATEQRWFTLRVSPIVLDAQRFAICAHADTTPQALLQEALRQGELRFRSLFDNLPYISVQGYGADGITRYWNAASERLYGFTAQEAIGKPVLDLIIPPDLRAEVAQAISGMVQTGVPIATAELSLQRKDGSRVPVLSSHAVVHTPGDDTEFFCIDVDLSTRKQMEDTLRESEERFRGIANATPVMIWLAGTDALCDWFNAGWLAFTGRTLAQELGDGWAEGVHPEDLQRCVDLYRKKFAQRLHFHMEFRLMHHSGQYRWIYVSGVPRFDAAGEFVGYIGSCVDEHEVQTVKAQLAAMTDLVPGVLYQARTTPEGLKFIYLSKGVEQLYGVTAEAAFADANVVLDRIVAQDRPAWRAALQSQLHAPGDWSHKHRIETPSGQVRWVLNQAVPQPQADGSVLWTGIVTDISVQVDLEQRLRRDANVFTHMHEAVLITDSERNIIDANAAFTRQTGYTLDEVRGQNPRFLKSGMQDAAFYQAMWQRIDTEGSWVGEVDNRSKSGEIHAVILNISTIRDADQQVTQYVGVATDIHQLKQQQLLLERVAHYDALTQLPNRVLLADRFRQAVAQSQRNHQLLALCYLDLNGFKKVNDLWGHAAGDAVLRAVAQRMTGELRGADTAARIGGDEFVLLLPNLENAESVRPMLDRLLHVIYQPIDLGATSAQVGVSIGVSLYPDCATDFETLLKQADQAMYQAKASGQNHYHMACPAAWR